MREGWYDVGWADEKKCRGCNKEEFTEKHRLYHCPCWKEVRNQIPEKVWDMGAEGQAGGGKEESRRTS